MRSTALLSLITTLFKHTASARSGQGAGPAHLEGRLHRRLRRARAQPR